jgi:surfeit locus 1 family protein
VKDYQLMTLFMHKYRFWLMTFAALVVAATTFSLGQWQLSRAAQKLALQAAIDTQIRLPAVETGGLIGSIDPTVLLHRQAVLTGSWRADHIVYLDNRPMSGKSGFVVLTPLVLAGTNQAILVQRGWVPRNYADRTVLPDISTPAGLVAVQGRIAPPPSRLYEFKGADKGRIRQNLEVESFAAEIALAMLPVTLLQTGVARDGLVREWAAPNFGVDKNYGYAFQWFGMCALVVFLYIWFQVFQPLRSRKVQNIKTP